MPRPSRTLDPSSYNDVAILHRVQGYHVARLAADLRDFLEALDLQVRNPLKTRSSLLKQGVLALKHVLRTAAAPPHAPAECCHGAV